ncbi:MAG: helix-turn-helix domain-containing protein, partial [Erysipelotrichaceae bacterium]
ISINTLRKEIAIINDYLEQYGCQIETRISVGYSLLIIDEAVAIPFIRQFTKDIDRFGYLDISDSKKENYIIRRVLCSNTTVSVDALIDKLFCSKSTILRLIEKTRSYLNRFNLEIKVKRNSGLYIEGNEWNKRMCLINQHKIYKHEYEKEAVRDFDILFLNNTKYPDDIRTIVLSNIPTYPSLAFAHIDIPIIVNFIILLKTRHSFAKELNFTDEQLRVARSSLTYNLTRDIISSLPEYITEDFNETEINALNILLAGLRKYKPHEITDSNQYRRLLSLVEEMCQFICKHCDISCAIDQTMKNDLAYFIIEQRNINLFKIYRDAEFFEATNRIGLMSSDVTAIISYYLHKYHNIILDYSALSRLYSIINRSIYTGFHTYALKRILVISRYSAYIANNIAVRIKHQFSSFVSKVDVCEYTDIPLIDIYDYDLIITDIDNGLISIPLPIVEIKFNRDKNDFDELINYMNHEYLHKSKEVFKPEDFHHVSFIDREEIFKRIYQDLNADDISYDEWITDIRMRDNYLSFERNKEIILITNLLYHTEKPVYKVYIND